MGGQPVPETEGEPDRIRSRARSEPDAALSVAAAAALLGVDERVVRRAIARGELAAVRRGRAFVVPPTAIDCYRRAHDLAPSERRPPLALVPDPVPPPSMLAAPSERAWRAEVPVPLTPLVGRDREAALVAGLLQDPGIRLVTLVGPGGIGKTRLALRVADEVAASFADGVLFVSLAPVGAADLVLPTVARALGIRNGEPQSVVERLATFFRGQDVLLVLDNFEHVVAAGPSLTELLASCLHLTILVTSRASLRVSGERVVIVPPLAFPDPRAPAVGTTPEAFAAVAAESEAVRLFVDRAQAADASFALTAANATAVAEICARLDGLPLAIELAAARTRTLAPATLLARLERPLALLTDGPGDQPPRLRSMRDAIAWSHDLLSPAEQALFRRLAVFTGGFTLEAAEGMAPEPQAAPPELSAIPAVLDALTALVDHSLVGRGGDDRYAMLEPVREYALERLVASGEADAARRRQAEAMAALVERAEPEVPGPTERPWVTRLEADLGNVRAALAWSVAHEAVLALRIGGALWGFWIISGLMAEGRRWLDAALATGTPVPIAVRAKALLTTGATAMVQGDFAGGLPPAETGLALWREIGDPLGEARALWITGIGLGFTGRMEEGARLLGQSLLRFEAVEGATPADKAWAARARSHLGIFLFIGGERDAGAALCEEGVARGRVAGSPTMLLIQLFELGGLLLDRGDPGDRPRARAALEESLALAWTRGEWWVLGGPLYALADLIATEGDPARAVRLIGAVDVLAEKYAVTLPPTLQGQVDRALALAAAMLGPEGVAAARAAGRGWSLAEAVAAALSGPPPSDDLSPDVAGAAVLDLTPRQLAVLRLLAEGRTDKEIAEALFISRVTASKHVAAILDRLGVPSRTAAVASALRHGLI